MIDTAKQLIKQIFEKNNSFFIDDIKKITSSDNNFCNLTNF